MIAVNKILVPLDFSETSTRVLEFARMLADACGASLHLLHVIACPFATPETTRQEQREACRRLEALLNRPDRVIRRATTSCELGTPASEILRYAADNGIDLIVMGTHSHGPLFRMATGSVAEAVIGLAPCPVLAVKNRDERMRAAIDPVATVRTRKGKEVRV
jgi:nucleotide-binding universal stress UspA family protein